MNPLTGNVTQTMGVVVRGDASGLTRAMGQGAASTKAFETQTTASAARWGAAWKVAAAGVIAIIALVAIGLGGAAKQAAEFESKMRNVNSLVQGSEQSYRALNEQVLALAKVVPQSATNLADGLYDITSSGFYAADSITLLNAAAIAASAGLATTADAVKGIAAVLNAYGLSAASSKDVSDALFQTVNLGVVRFDELTQVLSKVVGTAAAAKIPIEDVGAAIATMTLSGISSQEAGTSLNRVLQGLLQPSESLANLYSQLGYESGSAALESKGLYTVMEEIRTTTNGNVNAFLALFPEMRAFKGALALASAEGETYTRVQGQISDANVSTGATQRAFDEQMKATSNKWAIFTSGVASNAVTLGLKVLPAFNALMEVGQSLSQQFIPTLQAAYEILRPFLDSLFKVGVNTVEILKDLVEAIRPLGKALDTIVGTAVVASLTLLAAALEALTNLIAGNAVVIGAMAGSLLALFVPAITAAATSLQALWVRSIVAATGLVTMDLSAKGLSASLLAVSAISVTAFGAVAAIGAMIGGLYYLATQQGSEYIATIDEMNSKIDKTDMASVSDGIAQMTKAQEDLNAAFEATPKTSILTQGYKDLGYQKSVIAVNDALTEYNTIVANTTTNMNGLKDETGLTNAELAKLADAQGLDFSMAYGTEEAKANRDQLIQYLGDIEKAAGTSTQTMADKFGFDVEAMNAYVAAIEQAASDASNAFQNATNVIGTWKPNIGVEETTTAVEGLAKAREDLRKVEKDNARDSDAVINAQQRVADASEALTKAEKQKSEGTLTAFYRNAIETSRTFSQNIQSAVEMGLDPTVVAKLLKEGPEQAGPIVQQLVDDNSGALIQMMNDSEKTLAEINQTIVLQARLTARAVASDTDQMVRDLPAAMQIQTDAINGKSPEEIAKAMGLDKDEIQRIADDFGITIAEGIQGGYDAHPPYLSGMVIDTPWWAAPTSTGSSGRPSNVPFGAANGAIYPGYTPGRDIGFIGISGGEAIMRPEWTRAIGPDRINYWNQLARTGGVNAVRQATLPYLGGFAGGGIPAPQVVTVPITQRHETLSPIHIERMYASDVADFERQAADRRRRDRWGGRR